MILLLAAYLFASWWAWWFGGAFGHRSFVEFLSLLVIPFAHFLHKSLSHRQLKWLIIPLYVVLCYYSVGLTYEYEPPWDGSNWTYQSVWKEIKELF